MPAPRGDITAGEHAAAGALPPGFGVATDRPKSFLPLVSPGAPDPPQPPIPTSKLISATRMNGWTTHRKNERGAIRSVKQTQIVKK